MPNLEITPRERSALRAAAHSLHPVVLIGDRGLTDAVIQEIDRNLNAHGLIKVRAGGEDRESREEIIATICDQLSCALVHHLGKMLILYRPALEKEGEAQAGRRRDSDVYIPKKQAAAGRSAPKAAPRRPAETAPAKPARRDPYDNERPARPSLHKSKTAGRGGSLGGSVRRGSSMTLRAGARRGR
ncbi:YhbY family RNA-binding protein [Kerstersia similis]|uniref:YhbY family RNA-binding protein n=1 Tax=Kerstersia similis TaxID=206505 RepID=UPI0039F018BF